MKENQKPKADVGCKLVERLKKMAKMKIAFFSIIRPSLQEISCVHCIPNCGFNRLEKGFCLKNQTFCQTLFGPPKFLSLTLPPFED